MPITTLLLDLDGTLYPSQNGIWEAIANRMETYMHQVLKMEPEIIPAARQNFYQQYGTTLRGLQANFEIDSYEYLSFVHDIPIKNYLQHDQNLDDMLQNLPQDKWIFTNSDRAHALRVLNALGIEKHFKGILDIITMDFQNKPDPQVYTRALHEIGNPTPEFCLFADDSLKNLSPAKQQGLHTVWVNSNSEDQIYQYHIDTIHQLPLVLEQIEANAGDKIST